MLFFHSKCDLALYTFFAQYVSQINLKNALTPMTRTAQSVSVKKLLLKLKIDLFSNSMKVYDPVPHGPFCLLVNGYFRAILKILWKILYLSIFLQGLTSTRELPETGADLAMRALGWASLYSVGGFSLFCYGVWKMMGVSNVSMLISGLQIVKDLFLIPKHFVLTLKNSLHEKVLFSTQNKCWNLWIRSIHCFMLKKLADLDLRCFPVIY